MDVTSILALGTLLVGISGAIWTALKFNREDAKSAVGTMKEISSELRLELQRAQDANKDLEAQRGAMRIANRSLQHEVAGLRTECAGLRLECSALRVEVTKLRQATEAA